MLPSLPDPHALNAARAAQRAAAPATVILFGSRAAGRHRAYSDIDLLVITDHDGDPLTAESAARHGVHQYLIANPPRLDTDIIGMTRARFDRCRRAGQHIAGQAARYGIVMNDTDSLNRPPPAEADTDADDGYPDHWPETARRIERAEAWNQSLTDMMTWAQTWHQELIGFTAQQAVENALKGWLSAWNDHRTWGHELLPLWDDIRRREDWSQPELAEPLRALTNLFAFTRYSSPDQPGADLDWLSHYAARYRYDTTEHRMTPAERATLQRLVDAAVQTAVARIHRISGTADSDIYPGGVRPWRQPASPP